MPIILHAEQIRLYMYTCTFSTATQKNVAAKCESLCRNIFLNYVENSILKSRHGTEILPMHDSLLQLFIFTSNIFPSS